MAHETLIQLPNKDLWRGSNVVVAPGNIDEIVAAEQQDPMNRAMAAVLAGSAGGALTCLWCGLQPGGEAPMREHLTKEHKSVVEPRDDKQAALIAMHQLGEKAK